MFEVFEGCMEKKWEELLPNYKGYWRMYYRNSQWAGTWFSHQNIQLDSGEISDLNAVIREVCRRWPEGCTHSMKAELASISKPLTSIGENYLLKTCGFKLNLLVYCNTEFGNSDYPVRIYCYGR